MSTRPKVLFVLTSHSKLGSLDKPTGWYLPEFAHPYYKLAPHADVEVASPLGGEAPLDPSSVEAFKDDEESVRFLKEKEDLWKKTVKLEEVLGRAGEFDVVVYVGGHGPMFDLAKDAQSHQLIQTLAAQSKIVSAVCHGPAALSYVPIPNSEPPIYLISGHSVTGFSNAEEDVMQLSSFMPFMLEDALNKNSGGGYVKAEKDWEEKVVVSRGKGGAGVGSAVIITGQNPASASALGAAIWKEMQEKRRN